MRNGFLNAKRIGNTIDLYDGATYRFLRTIALDGDVTTQFYVVPRPTNR